MGGVDDGQPVAHFWLQEYDFWPSPPEGLPPEGRILRRVRCVERKIRTRLDLLSIPQSGGGGCQNVYMGSKAVNTKPLPWHLNGFPDGNNIGSTVQCRGEARRYTVHLN